jgi:hypothetical protein
MAVRREHQNTFPTGRIAETLLMFIRLRGGARVGVNPAFVYAPLADFYELSDDVRRLSLAEYYADEDAPGIAWHSEVNAAVKRLKKDGYLTVAAHAGKSAWRLTPYGAERADFWLKRMVEKTAALGALKVNDKLAWLDTEGETEGAPAPLSERTRR